MKYVLCILATASLLTACGNKADRADNASSARSSGSASSFGLRNSTKEPVVPQLTKAVDTRALVPVVKSAVLDATKGGAILRVVGDAGEQGYHNVGLVQSDKSTPELLVYEFKATPSKPGIVGSTKRSTEVQAAAFVSEFTIPTARAILIQASQNTIILRR